MRPAVISTCVALLGAIAAASGLMTTAASAQESKITVTNLDALVRQHPLPPGKTSDIVAERPAGSSDLQVVVESSIPTHVHDDTDHVLYIARGTGTAYLAGETRKIKPGDILFIPHGVKHGFEKDAKSGNLVMLVVETPSR